MPRTSTSADRRRTTVPALVERALNLLLPTAQGAKILCAVSGGVDSITMLDVCCALRKKLNLTIGVAHFNHQLRSDAGEDEALVRETAERLGCEFFSDHADVAALAAAQTISIEMAGRGARYAFFRSLLDSMSYDVAATAHTRDDNAETVILNLVRGTGLAGLSGIPPTRSVGGKQIIRPLLSIDKAALLAHARARGLRWRDDPSNTERSIPRNFVRLAVAPELAQLNPQYGEAIERTSGIIRAVLAELRPNIDRAKARLCDRTSAGTGLSIAIHSLKGYFDVSHTIALLELLRDTFPGVGFGATDLDRIAELLGRQTGARAQLEGGLLALRDRTHIRVSRRTLAPSVSVSFAVDTRAVVDRWMIAARAVPREHADASHDRDVEFIDADTVGTQFTVRRWRAGDVFVPLGLQRRKNVSDLLTDCKVPSGERRAALVVESNGVIIWVCGLRLARHVRITAATTRVIELSREPAALDA